jgi:DNA-3-methyladenine glycosylase II
MAAAVTHLRAADPRLAAVIDKVGACQLKPQGQIYEALFRSVLYQQLAGSAAAAIMRRVCEPYGGKIPAPADFLRAADEQLRAAGLSRQKMKYLRELAAAFAEGRLNARSLARLDDDALVTAVTAVHGIGEWTAHMLLMFCLGRPDVLPVGDYGVRKAMQRLYRMRELPKAARMHKVAKLWRPYRTVAAWYLWRSLEIG